MYEKLPVRVLGSCETIANASVVFTDKLVPSHRTPWAIVAGSVSISVKFVRRIEENAQRTKADENPTRDLTQERKHHDDLSTDQGQLNTILFPTLHALFYEARPRNTTNCFRR